MEKELDPVFCLEILDRFEPEARVTTTMTTGQDAPRTTLQAYMESTGNAVTKGYGKWVRFHDVLTLMCKLKDQSR